MPPMSEFLPDIDLETKYILRAKVVRDYVRATVVVPAIKRLYAIGMGTETFDIPTKSGRIVNVPAPSSVQVKALQTLIAIGIPPQIGVTDSDGEVLPGVFALAPLELDRARQMTTGGYLSGLPVAEVPAPADDPALTPGTAARVERGEVEVVEIEGEDLRPETSQDEAPGPLPPNLTLEQMILAKRRARRSNGNGTTNGNGNGNGSKR